MNSLKIKTTAVCNTCGCDLKRSKTIKVSSQDRLDAIIEVNGKIEKWTNSLIGKNCRICDTIIKDCSA